MAPHGRTLHEDSGVRKAGQHQSLSERPGRPQHRRCPHYHRHHRGAYHRYHNRHCRYRTQTHQAESSVLNISAARRVFDMLETIGSLVIGTKTLGVLTIAVNVFTHVGKCVKHVWHCKCRETCWAHEMDGWMDGMPGGTYEVRVLPKGSFSAASPTYIENHARALSFLFQASIRPRARGAPHCRERRKRRLCKGNSHFVRGQRSMTGIPPCCRYIGKFLC